jgi:hypothetical protein
MPISVVSLVTFSPSSASGVDEFLHVLVRAFFLDELGNDLAEFLQPGAVVGEHLAAQKVE